MLLLQMLPATIRRAAVKHGVGVDGAIGISIVWRVVVIVIVVIVVVVDWGVGLLVVRRHGKGGLVWIDICCVAVELVVARKVAVRMPVLESEEADQCGQDPEKPV